MAQLPLLKGTYADTYSRFRAALPRNLEPILADNGIANGYLRSAMGIRQIAEGPGDDRGSILWNNICYRVMGSKLVSVVGSVVTILGDVGDDGLPVALDYSFDRLAINSNRGLSYYNQAEGVTQVTDPDLGVVLDMQWISGYFMTVDDSVVVVTDLNDPYSVDPLKYGSSEEDPDPIVALRKVRGEAYVLNRYTIQNLQNIGGTGFPFQDNQGGLIPKGCVGSRARCDFLDTFAFVGSGRNEALSVYLAGQGEASQISNQEIDTMLGELTDDEQAAIQIEARVDQSEQRLYVHLPKCTLVYYRQASIRNENPVWSVLAAGILADQPYYGRHMTLTNGVWQVADQSGRIGVLDEAVETQFGETAGWRFDTTLLYNQSKGAIIRVVELVALPGNAPFGTDPTYFLSITVDGQLWGQERAIRMGRSGDRRQRIQWRPKFRFGNYAGIRFRGANTAIASFARCEVDIEGLSV